MELQFVARADILFSKNVQTCFGSTQFPYYMGTEVLSTGVKLLGHEVDHSPPSTARVDDEWSYTPTCLQNFK